MQEDKSEAAPGADDAVSDTDSDHDGDGAEDIDAYEDQLMSMLDFDDAPAVAGAVVGLWILATRTPCRPRGA